MIYKYIIPQIPPSNNRYIGRNARWQYNKVKAEWKAIVYYHTRNNKPDEPFEKAVIRIMYYFKDKRRRDPDNYSGKMLLDGLTAAGVIRDDNFHCIRLELYADCDKDNPRTEIEVEKNEM